MWSTISLTRTGPVAEVRFNRPANHNAVNSQMVTDLHDVLRQVSAEEDVHVVVLTGTGRMFCPGADVVALTSAADPEPAELPKTSAYQATTLLHEMPQVTIAAINGGCAGAGLTWAAACDLRIATARARFATSFLEIGVAGDMGGAWTLPRLLGAAVARDLFLLPRTFDAHEALRIGLVTRVYPDDSFHQATADLAAELAGRDATALRLMKANFTAAERMPLADYMDLETERHLALFVGASRQETVERLRAQGRRVAVAGDT